MLSDEKLLERTTDIIVEMLQKQFRQGILGEGIWKSKNTPGNFVAVVRLPDKFVALNVRIEVDAEWTDHLAVGGT